MNQTAKIHLSQRLSRRAFLRSLSITTTGALLAACGPLRSNDQAELAFGPQATPQLILPSPMPATTPAAVSAADDLALTEFLTLSAALTGVATLSPQLGRVYLQSLQASSEFAVTVADLYAQAGLNTDAPPTTVSITGTALEATGIFDQEATRALANKITELWYTGIYTNAEGEETVATYVDALAWQTLTFTKPTTICGYPGFWSEAWEPVLD